MYIGIDVGGMSIKAGVVDDSANIIYKEAVPTGAWRPSSEIVSDMVNLILNVIEKSGVNKSDISSIGIGIPGVCDSVKGTVIFCNNMNLDGVNLSEEIRKSIDVPVFLNNDANVAALAEYCVINKPMKCFIMVTLGTGVGGGIIIDGKIFSGFNGAAGEIGHIVINDRGEKCNCGRTGCLESFASVSALIRQTRDAMDKDKNSIMHKIAGTYDNINGKTAFDAAKQGDKTACEVVKNFISYVSSGVVNIINIFQPEMLVIGGAISKEGDYLLNPIKEICKKECYAFGLCENTEFRIASLGNDAGIIGAAMLGKSNGVI